MPLPDPVRGFFEVRPPNAPFSARLRQDPFHLIFRIRDAAWRDALLRMPLARGDCLLDVGGATGLLGDRMYALRGVRPVCVDIAVRGLREASNHGVAARPVCADAIALPFLTDTFGGSVSFETLEHIVEWPEAVGELVRVTRPGGHIVISAVSARWKWTWDWWLQRAGVDVLSRADHDPSRFIDEGRLLAVLRASGVDVLQARRLNAFATLAYDELAMVLALAVDRGPTAAEGPFLRVASRLRAVVGPFLDLTELPWRRCGRSNSILIVGRKR